MPKAVKGVLIECDPSIKAIIVKLDIAEHSAYVVEDLDDTTLVIKDSMLQPLKLKLEAQLAETQQPGEDSGSE